MSSSNTQIRIAMWSGPRNISTALMRSFENREDCFVSDEPFYAFYLKHTGLNHPLRDKVVAEGELNWDRTAKYLTGEIPQGKKIWYQKHMAQHNLVEVNLEWTKRVTNCFLIRNPSKVIISYAKKYSISSMDQLGYLQQKALFDALLLQTGKTPIVLDSADILKNPRNTLKSYCKEIGIHFSDKMLTWPPGKRKTDGAWGKYWYGKVEKSTGFQPYVESSDKVPKEYFTIYQNCMEVYQQLYQYRIH